jgi:hypothetical protein
MAWYTLEERVFLHDIYVKYNSACKNRRKFCDERVPSRQTIHNLVNKFRLMRLLIYKKQKQKQKQNKCRVLNV